MLLEQPDRIRGLDVRGEHEHADVGNSRRIRWAATMPSSVCVGGILMSTIATSGSRPRRWISPLPLGLPHDLDPGFVEQARDALAREHRVVGDHDAHGITALIVVPSTPLSTESRAVDRADAVDELGEPADAATWAPPRPSSWTSSASRRGLADLDPTSVASEWATRSRCLRHDAVGGGLDRRRVAPGGARTISTGSPATSASDAPAARARRR